LIPYISERLNEHPEPVEGCGVGKSLSPFDELRMTRCGVHNETSGASVK
jgi:hypothetical protein